MNEKKTHFADAATLQYISDLEHKFKGSEAAGRMLNEACERLKEQLTELLHQRG